MKGSGIMRLKVIKSPVEALQQIKENMSYWNTHRTEKSYQSIVEGHIDAVNFDLEQLDYDKNPELYKRKAAEVASIKHDLRTVGAPGFHPLDFATTIQIQDDGTLLEELATWGDREVTAAEIQEGILKGEIIPVSPEMKEQLMEEYPPAKLEGLTALFNDHANKQQQYYEREIASKQLITKSSLQEQVAALGNDQRELFQNANELYQKWQDVSNQFFEASEKIGRLPDLLSSRHDEIDRVSGQRLSQSLKETVQSLRRNINDDRIYHALQPALDPGCFRLCRAARDLTGIEVEKAFPYEAMQGRFELCDGLYEIGYIDKARFGNMEWEEKAPWLEGVKSAELDQTTEEYRQYVAQRYTAAVNYLLKDRIGTRVAIGALEGLSRIGTAQENTMETIQPLTDAEISKTMEEEMMWEMQEGPYPESIRQKYVIKPVAEVPWDIDQVAYKEIPEPTRLQWLRELVFPQEKLQRLLDEKEFLEKEIGKLELHVVRLDCAIDEVVEKAEYMESQYEACKKGIDQGSAYNEWLREELSGLLENTKILPEMVCFHNIGAVAKTAMQEMLGLEAVQPPALQAETELEFIVEPGM